MKDLKATINLIDLLAPIEELLAVTVNDTTYTLFITSVTGFLCHRSIFSFKGFNKQGIFQVRSYNQMIS